MLLFKQIFNLKFAPLFLACLAVLTTLFARHSASFLLIFMMLLTLCYHRPTKEIFKLPRSPAYWIFFLLSIWIGLSCVWNPEPLKSLITFLSFSLISFAGIIMLEEVSTLKFDQNQFIFKVFPSVITISLGLMGLTILNDYFLHFIFIAKFFLNDCLINFWFW